MRMVHTSNRISTMNAVKPKQAITTSASGTRTSTNVRPCTVTSVGTLRFGHWNKVTRTVPGRTPGPAAPAAAWQPGARVADQVAEGDANERADRGGVGAGGDGGEERQQRESAEDARHA